MSIGRAANDGGDKVNKQNLVKRWRRATAEGRTDEAARLAERMQPKTRKRLRTSGTEPQTTPTADGERKPAATSVAAPGPSTPPARGPEEAGAFVDVPIEQVTAAELAEVGLRIGPALVPNASRGEVIETATPGCIEGKPEGTESK